MANLEDLEIYRIAEAISDITWKTCENWEWFAKSTIGKQLVRAADSIGANIAEGYGRYAYRENIQFCYYARGSLNETRFFLQRALERNLIDRTKFQEIDHLIGKLNPMLNAYIKSIKSEIVRESLKKRENVLDTNDK
jgi:four helix bundle protein